MTSVPLPPAHLKLLSCLSLTPQPFSEIHGRLLLKGVQQDPAFPLRFLVNAGLAAKHGMRGKFTYSLTAAGEGILDEAAP